MRYSYDTSLSLAPAQALKQAADQCNTPHSAPADRLEQRAPLCALYTAACCLPIRHIPADYTCAQPSQDNATQYAPHGARLGAHESGGANCNSRDITDNGSHPRATHPHPAQPLPELRQQ